MKFFISHASKDAKYGEELIKLLRGVEVLKENIVFTSKATYGVPDGQNIYDWLKEKLNEDTFVIYLLSDNYYQSIACLNEMGASWISGKEHRTLILPGFEIDNPNFLKGAVDPREKVVFIDRKESIAEFLETINKKRNKHVEFNHMKEIITEFLNGIDKIKNDKNLVGTNNLEVSKNANEFTSQADIMVRDIINNNFSDEELLLLSYMIDMGDDVLRTGYMEDDEVSDIIKWENENILTDYLSKKYERAFNKFIRRNLITVYAKTEHGNPKLYMLKENISINLLNLPKKVQYKLNETRKKHEILLPF